LKFHQKLKFKAILLGKALLSPSEIQSTPISYQKLYTYNLGTAYVLKGDYISGKFLNSLKILIKL
jgi:hypothetical protein